MAASSPVEFTASDDDMLFYSYGLFGSGDSDHRNDCIPWIASKFQHHSLEAWTQRFSELMTGLSTQELKKQVERVDNEFDISGYVSDLHSRGIEPHVKDDNGNREATMDDDSDVEIVSAHEYTETNAISDDDDFLSLRPVRAKRKSRGRPKGNTPLLTEAQIKAQLEADFPDMGIGKSRARQSRRYIERELGHVSLVHQQLSKLKAELTQKLKDIDRGVGYGGLHGQKPAIGFWGNDGSANGGAEDPRVSETDALMHKFWNSYVSRYQREKGTPQESLSHPDSALGQKRAFEDVSGEVEEPSAKRPRNGNGKEEEAQLGQEEDIQPDDVDELSASSKDDSGDIDVDADVSVVEEEELSQDASREESRELEESILAESDSDLSEAPLDVENSEEEEEEEEEDSADSTAETVLKPVPKDFKILPPDADFDGEDEEDDEEDDEEENGEVDDGEEQESVNEDEEEEEEAVVIADKSSEDYDQSEDEKSDSPAPKTTSRRRSAGRANYKEIPPGVDDDEEDIEEEVEEEEEEEDKAPSRKRRTRTRASRRVVVEEDDDDDDDDDEVDGESEQESSEEESDYKSKPKRAARRHRQVDETASADESEEYGSDDDSADEGSDKSVVEEPTKPRTLSEMFHNDEKNRVSLFADPQSDGSSASESEELVEIVAVPKSKPKVMPRKRIGPVASLASSRGRARARPKFESSSDESSSVESSSNESSDLELDDDSDDDISDSE